MREWFIDNFWNDPVWASVISFIITAAIAGIGALIWRKRHSILSLPVRATRYVISSGTGNISISSPQHLKEIHDFLLGDWLLVYKIRDETREENVKIEVGDLYDAFLKKNDQAGIQRYIDSKRWAFKYFVDHNLVFELKDCRYDTNTGELTWIKLNAKAIVHTRESLKVIDRYKLAGNDNKGYYLVYTKRVIKGEGYKGVSFH